MLSFSPLWCTNATSNMVALVYDQLVSCQNFSLIA